MDSMRKFPAYNKTQMREGRGLGFTVAGGAGKNDAISSEDTNFYVTSVIDGGVAAADGRLRQAVGDVIISVNGTPYEGLTHREAIDILRRSPEEVILMVKRLSANAMETVVEIDLIKGDSGLGFTVGGGFDDHVFPNDNGVFVTKIVEGGVAYADGRLAVGDRLMAVNDVNLQNVSHSFAVSTLKLTTGRVHLIVGKAPMSPETTNKKTNNNTVTPASARMAFGGQTELQFLSPMLSIDGPPQDEINAETRSTRSSSASRRGGGSYRRRARNPSLPELVPRVMTDKDIASFVKEPREVVLTKKSNQGLGFNIVGGKEGHGIFISSIVPGGLADVGGELRRGDQLLAANGVAIQDATHEEAVHVLKTSGQIVRLTVQYRPEEFGHFERMVRQLHQKSSTSIDQIGIIKPHPVKTMFIRALFDYDPTKDHVPSSIRALYFAFGDILHVVLPPTSVAEAAHSTTGVDWWQARRVVPWSDPENSAGFIPSKTRIEAQEAERRKNLATVTTTEADLKEVQSTHRRGRGLGFSRRLSFNKKDKLPRNDFFYEFGTSLSYEPVVQLQVRYTRPVVILGPLKDIIYDQLMADFPDDYRGCVPHTSRPQRPGEFNGTDYHFVLSRDQMERDIHRIGSPYIEAGVYNGHLYGITVGAVRDVAKQNKHCLLDVSAEAIVRLQATDLYPMAILIRPANPLVMSNASWDKPVSEEESKKAYEVTTKLLHDFGKYFTGVISAETPSQVYERVKEIIAEHSQPVIWVASNDQL